MENEDRESISPDPGDMAILSEETDETKEPSETDETDSEDTEETTEETTETSEEDTNEETDEEEEETEDTEETNRGEKKEGEETEGDEKPSWKAIREYDPEFFKKFPEVKAALGRDLEYRKIYPTVEEARESGKRLAFHTALEESILEGKAGLLLANIHKTDEGALNKFAMDFLPTLFRGNPPLYEKVTTPIIKNVLRAAIKEGEKTKSDDLVRAARWISNFVFDSAEIPEDEKVEETSKGPSESDKKLSSLMQKRIIEFKDEFRSNVSTDLENLLKNNLGPDSKLRLPTTVVRSLTRDILGELADVLGKDDIHVANMERLWKDAEKADFSRQNLSQLTTAYLARAKKILPTIQKKHLTEALKDLGRKLPVEVDSKTRKLGPKKEPEQKKTEGVKGYVDPKKVDWKNTSDEDLLNDRASLKR